MKGWHPLLVLLGAALGTLSVPARALAQEADPFDEARLAPPPAVPAPARLRLLGEGSLTNLRSDSMRWPDGTTAAPSCPNLIGCDPGLAVGLGLEWSSESRFGVGLRSRLHRRFEGDAMYLGRRLYVLEVLSVSRVNLPWPWQRKRHADVHPYVALPLGLAWTFQTRTWSRAVNEDWNSRTGLSVGAAVGFELFWTPRWGVLLEVGYQARFMSADVTSTPVDEPQAQVTERVTMRQHQILLSVGIVFGLHS
jgi:hypothetical protein